MGLPPTISARSRPASARFAALLTPQGKIIVDFIVAEAQPGGWRRLFPRLPARAGAPRWSRSSNFTSCAPRSPIEDLSAGARRDGGLGRAESAASYGLSYADPRLPALGTRVMLPPSLAGEAAAELGATLVDADGLRRPPHRTRRAARRHAISSMATPSRTKPTWISSPASISTRAAMSARRWCRASSIAPSRAAASCRSPTTIRAHRPACR